jgi:hypothetical protein
MTARAPASPRMDRPAAAAANAASGQPNEVVVSNQREREPEPQAIVAPEIKPTYPARAFVTKGLVENGQERRLRDVRLVLTGRSMTLSDDATRQRLQVVPFDDVKAIAYSHGRDPMWNSSGRPTPIVRTSGRFSRVFGIGGSRHWISLMTTTTRRFVILRVDDAQVGDVLSALEERTGRTAQLLESRKGAD